MHWTNQIYQQQKMIALAHNMLTPEPETLDSKSVNLRYKQCIFHPVTWTNEDIFVYQLQKGKQKNKS